MWLVLQRAAVDVVSHPVDPDASQVGDPSRPPDCDPRDDDVTFPAVTAANHAVELQPTSGEQFRRRSNADQANLASSRLINQSIKQSIDLYSLANDKCIKHFTLSHFNRPGSHSLRLLRLGS